MATVLDIGSASDDDDEDFLPRNEIQRPRRRRRFRPMGVQQGPGGQNIVVNADDHINPRNLHAIVALDVRAQRKIDFAHPIANMQASNAQNVLQLPFKPHDLFRSGTLEKAGFYMIGQILHIQ